MNTKVTSRVHTLEQALRSGQELASELRTESKARRSLRIFAAFTDDHLNALTAFLTWRLQQRGRGPRM